MDTGQIFLNALKYPSADFKKVLILGILTILTSLIIPGFLLLGYLFKIIKSSIEDSSELPDFNEWIQMFLNGLKVFMVLFIYSLVPGILILLGIWAVLLHMLYVTGAGILFTGIALQIVVSFIIPIALANMVYHNELAAGFRLREIIGKIKELGLDYLIWYLMIGGVFIGIIAGLVVIMVVYFISSSLVFPLIIGIIVSLVILPYFMMFFAKSISMVYSYEVSDHEYYRHKKQIN